MTYGALHLLETTTFPGWPSVDPLSNFQLFMLCLGAPLLVAAALAVIILGGGHRKAVAEESRAAGLSLDNPEQARVSPARRAALGADESVAARREVTSSAPAARPLSASDADGEHRIVEDAAERRSGGATAAPRDEH